MVYFGENLRVKGLVYGCYVYCMFVIKLNFILIFFLFFVIFGVFFLSKFRFVCFEKEFKYVMWIFCLVQVFVEDYNDYCFFLLEVNIDLDLELILFFQKDVFFIVVVIDRDSGVNV